MMLSKTFHQGLQCVLRLKESLVKQSSGTEIHHNFEIQTCYPLKYIVDSSILIVLLCTGKSPSVQKGINLSCVITKPGLCMANATIKDISQLTISASS